MAERRAHGRQPYRYDLEPLAFAGLWEFTRIEGKELLSTATISEANSLVAPVHHRMPVMLMPEDYDRWLDPSTSAEEGRGMLKPYDAKLMEPYEVNRATILSNASSRSLTDA